MQPPFLPCSIAAIGNATPAKMIFVLYMDSILRLLPLNPLFELREPLIISFKARVSEVPDGEAERRNPRRRSGSCVEDGFVLRTKPVGTAAARSQKVLLEVPLS
jgi:hypothetical protein